MYDALTGQFRRYIGHVTYNFGGVYETLKKNNQEGNVYEYVNKATQKEAFDFVDKQVFTTPTWLINKDVVFKAGVNPETTILLTQETALNKMMSANTMNKLLNAEATLGNNTYTMLEMLGDMKKSVFSELNSKKPVDIYRRNLQKSYVERLGSLVNPTPGTGFTFTFGNITPTLDSKKSDMLSYLKGHARELKSSIDATASVTTDKPTKYHLLDLSDRLKKMLDPK
jgi:hypothetical protein